LDPVYVGIFKCNLRRIVDYPNLWGYVGVSSNSFPGVAESLIIRHRKALRRQSHPTIQHVPRGVSGMGLDQTGT